jgi:flagellin-like hook-associated protein FlgL
MTGDAANDGALDLITRGLDAILQTRVNFGLTWKVVNESQLATEAQNALLNNEIVSMEQVDRAEVTTRLLDLETQLQASYSATGRVMRLNIWNYVR